MQKIKLDERLNSCAEYVRNNSVVADIGTDHAYLPAALLLSGRIKKAIGCDINEKPLESAKQTVLKYNLSDKISLRLCNGLQGVNADEFDDLVIAGMGGEMIISILSDAEYIKNSKYRLILQPMSKAHLLRKFLCESGFCIIDETASVSSGKVYTVICAQFCGKVHNNDEYFYYVGALADKYTAEAALYRKKIKSAIQKQALGILSADKNSDYAKALLKTVEKIKD